MAPLYLGWPQPVLKLGAILAAVVITLIGEELMAQPQVMAVVTEAIATVEKATEHHGKQNTQPFNRVFICDPHLLHPRNKKKENLL